MEQETQDRKLTLSVSAVSRRQFMQLTAGASLAALLAACAPPGVQPQAGSQPAATTSSAAAKPSEGGTLVWLSHQEIAGLGPNDLGATMQNILIAAIHNSLVGYDTDNKMYPDLAEAPRCIPIRLPRRKIVQGRRRAS